jgi:hypothetical protein
MRTYMIWQGGLNYTPGDISDTEEFVSMQAAADEFARRARGGDPYYPCVADSEGHLFLTDPRTATSGDVYPDRIVTLGARGGVRIEHC